MSANFFQMGAHRFTLLKKNMVVAATDMPDYDDRKQIEDQEKLQQQQPPPNVAIESTTTAEMISDVK